MTVHPKLIALSLSMVGGIAIAAILILVMSSGTVSAQQVLTDAQAKTSSVETYRFAMEFWQTAQVEGDPPRYETRTDAVVVFDEGMHVVVRANDSYSESLLIEGGRQYQRDSADGAWEMHPSSFDRSNMATLDSNRHFRIIDDLTQSTIVGEESLRGMGHVPSSGVRVASSC